MPTKEKTQEWRRELRALLDAADGLLAQLREGDGLFFSAKDSRRIMDGRGGFFIEYGAVQSLFRVTEIRRARNGALRLRLAKPLSLRHQPVLPVLKASCLCDRFVPEIGEKPPLLSYDARERGQAPRELVSYRAYNPSSAPYYDTPPTLAVGVDLFGLSEWKGRVFESVEALQGVIDRYSDRVIARVRPGEVKVLLTNSTLKER